MRLTRPGEPGFIRAIEPAGAHRLSALHIGGGYFSRPTTFIVLYGSDQPFADEVTHYGDALAARGFTPRQPLQWDNTSAEFKGDASNECFGVDSNVSQAAVDKLAPGSASYTTEYSVVCQRTC